MMCALEARARDANKFLDTVEVPIFFDCLLLLPTRESPTGTISWNKSSLFFCVSTERGEVGGS